MRGLRFSESPVMAPGRMTLVRVFAFFAALMGFACLLLTPPGQTPDEHNHLARIVQISQGGLVGLRLNDRDAGGYLPVALPSEALLLDDLRFHSERRVQLDEVEALAQLHWSTTRHWVSFPNTVIYAPVTYLPAALTALVARESRMSVLQTSYVIRAVNLVMSLALCCAGLALARRGRLFLTFIASLPMVAALNASCSQDGLIFGIALLVASGLTRIDEQNRGTGLFWGLITVGCAILTVSKPPLLLCALIPLGMSRPGHRLHMFLPALFSILAFLVWQVGGLSPAKIQFMPERGVSDAGQIHWVLTHPFAIPGIAIRTMQATWLNRIHEFIGVLGWFDTMMPRWYYWLVYGLIVVLAGSGIARALRVPEARQTRNVVLATLCGICLAVGAVFFSLYVIWTPVGAPAVDGAQGRYFLPLTPFLALLFALSDRRCEVPSRARTQWAVLGATGLYLFVETAMLTVTLATRYW